MKVDILQTNNDGRQEVVLICKQTPEGVSFEGNQTLSENLKKSGIRSHADKQKILFPSDGLDFLNELQYTINSPYLRATAPIHD